MKNTIEKKTVKKEFLKILSGGITLKKLKAVRALLPDASYMFTSGQHEGKAVTYRVNVNHFRRLKRAWKKYGEQEVLRYLLKYS